MSSELHITRKDRLNYTKYARFLYELCPGTMLQAFKWLYIGKSTSIKDFLILNPEKFSNITDNDKEAIKNGTDVSDMDVTFLYKLLQRICGLAEPNNPIWFRKPNKDQEKPLEYALYQLKESRNIKSHPNPNTFMKVSDEMLKNIMTELQSLCEEVLVLSARKAGITGKIKNKSVNKVKDDFQKEFRSLESITDEEFMKICRGELRIRSSDFQAALYVLPRLQKILHSGSDTDMAPFPLNVLLDFHTETSEKPKVFVVSGGTGVGKTSLCSFLSQSWSQGLPTVEHLQDYDLLIPMKCGNILTRDLQNHLRTKIMPNSSGTLDVAELLEFLKRKNILWVFDGWDEATKEAVGLLTDLLGNLEEQFKTHTVLITSRPHRIDDLLKRIKIEAVLRVSLLGFNMMEIQNLFQIKAERIKTRCISEAHYREYLDKCERIIRRFDFHFLEALRNPLALQLISVLLENPDPEELEKGYSFSQLYLHVKEAHKKRVLRSLMKEGNRPENIYKKQLEKWLKILGKVAFTQISIREGLILSGTLKKKLTRGFHEDLADICLSTFLEHREGRYLFLHPTQMTFYASFHILNILVDATNVEKECDNIFEQNLRKYEYGYALDPYLGSYDILQQCATTFQTLISKVSNGIYWPHLQVKSLSLSAKQVLCKTVDLVTDIYTRRIINGPNVNKLHPLFLNLLELHAANIHPLLLPMKLLAKLIHNSLEGSGSPECWFEIIKRGNYDELLLREIGHYIDTDEWIVREFDLKAAKMLMSYTLPSRIVIAIGSKLEEPNDLISVLLCIAGLRIEVHLLLICHSRFMPECDLSNKYLDFLLEDKAKCRLISFEGHLDINGLQTLLKAKYLQSLSIRTKDNNAIKSLHSVIEKLKKLASFTLLLDMKSYPSPRSPIDTGTSVFKRTLRVNLVLPHIQVTNVVDASIFVSKLCHDYETIHLGFLPPKRTIFFMKKLKNVRVAKFLRWELLFNIA